MKISIPKIFLGKPIAGSLERVLAGTPAPALPQVQPITNPLTPITGISNPANYIILPGKIHGSYSYGDLIVAKHRLGYDSQVERAAKDLGIQVANTSQEQDRTGYIGNINWETALKLNKKLGNDTFNIRQFIDFLELLKAGKENKSKVYDGTGNKIDSLELTRIYNEIREVREPWRSEWLDAKFTAVRDAPIYIEFDHNLQGNSLVNTKKEEIKGHVTSDSWINESSFNHLGLPTKKSSKKELYFWTPVSGRVARFLVYSDSARLDCYGYPTNTNAGLGVRAVRKKI